jgi:hypothetical protein
MEAHRLRAPATDGTLLSEPALEQAPAVLTRNRGALTGWDHDFQGRRADVLRRAAREDVLALARSHHDRFDLGWPENDGADGSIPWILTGHQPELYHPGVWAKNFAAAGMASRFGGLGVNLVVDNDVPHAPSIRVPAPDGAGTLRWRLVEFDTWPGESPYEDWAVRDEACFRSFPDRLRDAIGPRADGAVIEEFWPFVRRSSRMTDRVGLRFSTARHALEETWGVTNLEIPLSQVCQSNAFLWFLCHILAHANRFRAIHNEALAAYRRRYGVRSTHHPVPALAERDGWCEVPFWAWRAGEPRRHPLLVRSRGDALDVRIQGEEAMLAADLPLGPDREACCAVERLREVAATGVRLRTRALTTTMFARLMLGDLFVHGIGGAKYDELGDAIVRSFFGLEPPGYLALSLTAWPGLPVDPATPERLRAVESMRRDLKFNPQRHLDAAGMDAGTAAAVAARDRAVAMPQETRRRRIARFRAIRDATDALRPSLAGREEKLREEAERIERGLAWNRLAQARDVSFVAHQTDRLRPILAGVGGRAAAI